MEKQIVHSVRMPVELGSNAQVGYQNCQTNQKKRADI